MKIADSIFSTLLDRVVKILFCIVTFFFRNLEKILEHPTANMERLCTATHPLSWVLFILDSCSRSAPSLSNNQHSDEVNYMKHRWSVNMANGEMVFLFLLGI